VAKVNELGKVEAVKHDNLDSPLLVDVKGNEDKQDASDHIVQKLEHIDLVLLVYLFIQLFPLSLEA
jgi:hypothetical protein